MASDEEYMRLALAAARKAGNECYLAQPKSRQLPGQGEQSPGDWFPPALRRLPC
ncbi:Protein of unknown function [Lactobacillus delbrueckii subsp. lactis]|nr:Protein of unknown function [Lactobacillus delbrueckii subsp. lactis]